MLRKIIRRARQNHLLDNFRSETKTMSSDLINQVYAVWRVHVRENVAKALPISERPIEGHEEKAWHRLGELIQDKAWKQECLRRDEKFDMHFSSAVRLCNLGFEALASPTHTHRLELYLLFKVQSLFWRVGILGRKLLINLSMTRKISSRVLWMIKFVNQLFSRLSFHLYY